MREVRRLIIPRGLAGNFPTFHQRCYLRRTWLTLREGVPLSPEAADHGVPEEVPYENYLHYRKRALEFA